MGFARDPSIVVRGDVSSAMVAYALEKVSALADRVASPLLDVEVRLDRHADPARVRPNHAEVTFSVDGRFVRAHRSAETMSEAIDRTIDRLRRRLESVAEGPQSRQLRHRDASWHHGDEPTHRPAYFPRPADERGIVRRKTFAVKPESIEDALWGLEALDHAFYLFVNEETGEENLVFRDDDSGYAISQPTTSPEVLERVGIEIRSVPGPVEMTVPEACGALDDGGLPFVFFSDAETGRGRVLYRRYDGHYGLITPA